MDITAVEILMPINIPNWCRRSTLKSCRVQEAVFACIALIGLTCGSAKGVNALTNQTDVCLSLECIRTATAIVDRMKTEIKPCDDFYGFACGAYVDKTSLPEDEDEVSSISELSDNLYEHLRDILTEKRPEKDPKYLRLPYAFYEACMNTALIETLGDKPIQTFIQRLGGWPVMECDCWDVNDSWTWQETVKKLRHFGFNISSIVGFSIRADFMNTDKRIIHLDQSITALDHMYLVRGLNDTLVSEYYDYMVDMAVLFGADMEKAKTELRKSLQFEMNLAHISWPQADRRNSSAMYNLRSIKQLEEDYPYIQWLDYINALLPDGLTVDENEHVNLMVPSFFEGLGKLIQHTKTRDIANYMIWRAHDYSADYLSEKFRKRKLQFTTALPGKKKQVDRWKQCVHTTSESLPISLTSLYVRKHFSHESRDISLEIAKNMRDALKQVIDNIPWMDRNSKEKSKQKTDSITTNMGYPDELLDKDKLKKYYRKLRIDPNKYLESFLRKEVFNTDYSFTKLKLPVNKFDWILSAHPAVVNAYYSPIENSIKFPASILQGQFFDARRARCTNYGAIGSIIGHELCHSLDVLGDTAHSWLPETQNAFMESALCVMQQYGSYKDEESGINLDGINTLIENIADNGGVKAAYLAYSQWLAKNGEEPQFPGLNYTSRQIFWISAAQIDCEKLRKETFETRLTNAIHSPGKFRVRGYISNMNEFARDFECARDAPMNPANKCEVW